ncbi:GNAT family N-acetyltransferase [Shewanella woodyi]|uniref:GCN5-related N-acetyltransferase n=1 Tax=Shewanella woodyi (strain ATCC 51908 / MS32) TaxID=392500 RepID=B1KPM5_SHEWM|nr:GNAT family N-acetyltransferase [Shewanella woodyi]ACA86178.1 GCN5-related N-acetyltransferase [Shewanella woodyi ATCC 51908]
MIVLETDRLRLRYLTLGDAAFILELLNTPGFLDNIGDRGVRDRYQAETYLIEGPIASYQEHGFGLYLVELKSTGERIGLSGIVKRENLQFPDLGYAFLPHFWGKGYALESGKGVLSHAKKLALSNILGVVSPGNDASIAVLEKLGMQFECHQKWSDGSDILRYNLQVD